jgi:Rps23 Pro-64 3,4-dihydroxylase Tpa1-like proline 4-hydroxylase
MLNPELDSAALAARYAEDGRVRINDLLDPAVAERIRTACIERVPFDLITFVDNRAVEIPEAEMRNLPRTQVEAMQRQIMSNAARGIGYAYGGYRMGRRPDGHSGEEFDFLHSVFDYLNGPEVLEFIAAVTGRSDLQSADAQYTRYISGQFLTRHLDEVEAEKRRLAYVISFSHDWHPDWGGLLQFFQPDGTPRDAWLPKFNSMSLFDVSNVHSVTYVAPFTPEPRLSLTGWFRALPREELPAFST